MSEDNPDTRIRMAAFEHVRKLSEVHDYLTHEQLKSGFIFEGERISIYNRQLGIFKPRQMQYLLSIKTVIPKPGRQPWYDDQLETHQQIFKSNEMVDYAFTGKNPEAFANRWLREACWKKIPIIYFIGIAPGCYQAMFPAFISAWDADSLKVRVSFGMAEQGDLVPPEAADRQYAIREVKQRLHQATFRQAVIEAYGGRCAVSRLPEQRLLDAAHIIPDRETLGRPAVPNGLPLSKIHHAAFDAHLIGIDPVYKLHVSDRLLDQNDGPMLDALKQLKGSALHLPSREKDRPNKELLEIRFQHFKDAA